MSECDRIRKRLPGYAVGGPGGRARAAIARHIETCPACHAELAALDRTGELIGAAGPLTPPSDIWASVSAEVLARPRQAARPRTRRSWRVAAGLVALLLLALAVVLVRPFRPAPLPVTVEVEAEDADTPATIESHLSAQWSVPLADETAVGLRFSDLEGT